MPSNPWPLFLAIRLALCPPQQASAAGALTEMEAIEEEAHASPRPARGVAKRMVHVRVLRSSLQTAVAPYSDRSW